MNILMMTNTYKPILGGLEKSVEAFAGGFRKRGHRVVIVAPEYEGMEPETDVIRIPAIQRFNGTDFSVQLPIPGMMTEALGDFVPHIVHSHHPFLVGDTALRVAYKYNAPLVFTHHTLYDQNVHYVAPDSEPMKSFVVQLATGYANLTDRVFAPSESVKKMIEGYGVETPVDVVPTGIEVERFASGDGGKVRREAGIPDGAFVVGHVGRLAPEKNLEFLADAVIKFLKRDAGAHFLLTGKGPLEEGLKKRFQEEGLAARLHFTGPKGGQDLVDAYHAADVFAFASQSETQGLVLAEAMAGGVPVVAVDAPGVRDVVRDGVNGRLLPAEDAEEFASALAWTAGLPAPRREALRQAARAAAAELSMDKSLDKAAKIYSSLIFKEFLRRPSEDSAWERTLRLIQAHWDLAKNLTTAATEAIIATVEPKEKEMGEENTAG